MARSRKYKAPSLEELRAEATQHNTRGAFQAAAPTLYSYAYRYGLLDEICQHMTDARKVWTLEKLQAEAGKYSCRKDFLIGSNSAYQAARTQLVLDQICAHMVAPKGTYDVLYLLRVDGTNTYKIGSTSKVRGLHRIEEIKRKYQKPISLVNYTITPNATYYEQRFKQLGQPVEAFSSEFRDISAVELRKFLLTVVEDIVERH